MFYRYVKRRSIHYLNVNLIEQIIYYSVEDNGAKRKELAIHFSSGKIHKETNKPEEMYEDLKELMDKNNTKLK